MQAANTFRALGLGVMLALTGCVSTHYAYDDTDYGPPPYGHHHHHHGVDLVWDAHFGLYTVVGLPALYWYDGWYWRHAGGHWERCDRPRGGHWARVHVQHVPQRVHRRYASGGHDGRHDSHFSRERSDPRDGREVRHHERREPVQLREPRDRREPVQAHDRREDHRDARPQRHEARRPEEARRERTVEPRQEVRRERPERREQRVERRPERRQERVERRPEQREERVERREERAAREVRAPQGDRAPERAEPRRERSREPREARDERRERRDESRNDSERRGRGGDYAQRSER
jgi:hypothetical protein